MERYTVYYKLDGIRHMRICHRVPLKGEILGFENKDGQVKLYSVAQVRTIWAETTDVSAPLEAYNLQLAAM